MPRNADDVETFLYRLNRNFDHNDGTFLVSSGSDGPPIAVHVAEPIVVVRVDIGIAPSDDAALLELYKKLLDYNANDLVHAAYGLEDDEIVLASGLELENIDLNELAAVLVDMDLALARHIKTLRQIAAG